MGRLPRKVPQRSISPHRLVPEGSSDAIDILLRLESSPELVSQVCLARFRPHRREALKLLLALQLEGSTASAERLAARPETRLEATLGAADVTTASWAPVTREAAVEGNRAGPTETRSRLGTQ